MATLETFAYVALVLAWGFGVLVLVWTWSYRHLTLLDRLLLSGLSLVPWYTWPIRPIFLSPDYWTWELPYALCTAALTVAAARINADRVPRSLSYFVVGGLWIAIGATLKVGSMTLLGALPALVYLIRGYQSPAITVRNLIVLGISTVAGCGVILWLYFLVLRSSKTVGEEATMVAW